MSRTTEVQRAGASAIVVRQATGPDDASYLRATADRLEAAAHPGVVEVVSSHGDGEHWELRLVHAGRPVELVGPLPAEQVAGTVAAVAAILADLHAAGIVHGDIEGSHVLIGRTGRPVLCGFGPRLEAVPARPEDDVAAVGALIVALLGPDHDLEPIPDHRWRRTGSAGWARRSLLLIADHACAEPPTRRPTARRLAAAIGEAVPGAAPAEAAIDVAADPVEPPSRSRLTPLVAAVLGVIALGAGALRLLAPVAPPVPVVAASPPTTSTPATTTTTVPVAVDGTSVAWGGLRYEVGQPGDLVVVGDWDGDGVPTPAVLRPSTGEVFVFAAWTSGADVVAHAVATVAGAVDLLVVGAGGRDQLVARRFDGTRYPIDGDGVA